MEIAFETLELRKVCEDGAIAIATYGTQLAEGLQGRLADIKAAKNLGEMPVGNPHEIIEDSCPRYSISISTTHHIVFDCNDPRLIDAKSGRIDWSRVTRVKVARIEDMHA